MRPDTKGKAWKALVETARRVFDPNMVDTSLEALLEADPEDARDWLLVILLACHTDALDEEVAWLKEKAKALPKNLLIAMAGAAGTNAALIESRFEGKAGATLATVANGFKLAAGKELPS